MTFQETDSEAKLNPPARDLQVVILGAGVSGLSTAFELLQTPSTRDRIGRITIVDPRPTVGGLLCKSSRKGYLLEGAAQGVLGSRGSFVELTKALNLTKKRILSPRHMNRFLILNINAPYLAAISPNPALLVLRGILSLRGVLRAIGEIFIRQKNQLRDETLYGFFERRFGSEVASKLVIPLATGIWGGGARTLVARHVFPKLTSLEMRYGGIIKGALLSIFNQGREKNREERVHGLITFPDGIETLTLELHAKIQKQCEKLGIELRTRLGVRAREVLITSTPSTEGRSRPHAQFAIKLADQTEILTADVLFSSIPLWRETVDFHAQLNRNVNWSDGPNSPISETELQSFLDSRIAQLRSTPSHGLTVVGIGGKDTKPPPQGFGALAPEDSPDLLGVLYIHSIAPQHVPKGHFLFRVMIGGDRAPELARAHELQCLDVARTWLRKLNLITAEAEIDFEQVFRWPAVIPLQDQSHDERLRAIMEMQQAFPGLHFIGNYIAGVGVHDCLLRSKQSVSELAKRLTREASKSKEGEQINVG